MGSVFIRWLSGLAFYLCAAFLWAAGGHVHSHAHGDAHAFDFGAPGLADKADRSVEITLGDMYYRPHTLEVKSGETVRFVLHNEGELLHEFNLGDARMHLQHQQEMLQMQSHGMLTPTGINADHAMHENGEMMRHDDPNSVLVEPGKSAELVWTFANAGTIEFACNVPGHYQAGMVGKLRIRP